MRKVLFEGSVSGGCVESSIITEAQYTINQGKPRLLTLGVSNDSVLGCRPGLWRKYWKFLWKMPRLTSIFGRWPQNAESLMRAFV